MPAGALGTTVALRVVQSSAVWLPLTQAWLYAQVRNLPSDVRSEVVCGSRANRLRFPRGRVRSPMRRPWTDEPAPTAEARRARFLAARIAAHPPAVVHSHFGQVGWRDREAIGSLDRAIAHVVSFYGHDLLRLPTVFPEWKQRYRLMFDQADRFLCEGPVMAKTLVAQGAPASKVKVHHLGVDVERIPFRPGVADPTVPLNVLMVGRFVEKKGFPDGLRAFGAVARRHPVRLTLVGDADDRDRSQEEKQAVLTALRDCGAADRVRLAGYLSPRALLREALAHHILLAPSRTASDGDTEGGCPMTVPELGATGLTVVSTTHADLPMLVRDGETGFTAPEADWPALAGALERAIDARKVGLAEPRAFRALIEEDFNARRQGRLLAQHYQEVSGS